MRRHCIVERELDEQCDRFSFEEIRSELAGVEIRSKKRWYHEHCDTSTVSKRI